MATKLSSSAATTSATAAPAAKVKKPRAKKSAAPVVMEHAQTLEPVTMTSAVMSEDDELQSLLQELGVDDAEITSAAPANDEVVVELATPEASEEPDMQELETIAARAEAVALMIESATPDHDDGSAPTGDGGDVVAEAGAPKKERVPRKHYSDKVERLKDRMGASLGEYMVLTAADAMVEDEAALQATMDATLQIIRDMNSKEKNRASGFIEFLSGKKAKLNNVLERVLSVLERDGYVQTGNEGNVFKDLLSRPYSPASARAMGGNTIGVFRELKVIIPNEGVKGRYIANPDSLLLAKAKSMLTAAAKAPAAAPAAVEPEPETEVVESEVEEVSAAAAAEPEEALM